MDDSLPFAAPRRKVLALARSAGSLEHFTRPAVWTKQPKEQPMPGHPHGNPDLIRQHKAVQRNGDQDLKGGEPRDKVIREPDEDGAPEERIAGIVKPDDGSRPHPPRMKGNPDHGR